MKIFRTILAEIRALRADVAVLTATTNYLAEEKGYKLRVSRDTDNGNRVLVIKQINDNHTTFYHIEEPEEKHG